MATPLPYIVLFDGWCNLCHGSVRFIIRRDPKEMFVFASLQSEQATALFEEKGVKSTTMESLVLIKGNRVFRKSSAALEIARSLNGLWPLCYVFVIVPRPIRDRVYDLVARNRYRLFGKRDHCTYPKEAMKNRFLK